MSSAAPEYVGISYIELHVTDAPAAVPDSAALVGTGSLFALSDNKNLGGHGGRNLHLGAMLRTAEDWLDTRDVDWSDPAATRTALLAEFADWTPALTDLIRHCDDEIVARRIYALPIGHSWPRTPGVTLVGDAAHLMSPFAGEGANAAMLDGCELALALIEHGDDVERGATTVRDSNVPALRRCGPAVRPRARHDCSPMTPPEAWSSSSAGWMSRSVEPDADGIFVLVNGSSMRQREPKWNFIPELSEWGFRIARSEQVTESSTSAGSDPTVTNATGERAPRRLRADAQRNIDSLLEAAKTAFATSGVDAPAKEVVDLAGVGVGTLYRHFPQRRCSAFR